MVQPADVSKKSANGWTVHWIAAVLIVVGVAVFAGGVINEHCTCPSWPNLGQMLNDIIIDFYANVSIDCLSIAFTILVIDRLNERRADEELKEQLIRQLHNTDKGLLEQALAELRARGWLEDGSLRGTMLRYATFEGLSLAGADLRGARLDDATLHRVRFSHVDLRGARLDDTDLSQAYFYSAKLGGASFFGANVRGSRIHHSDLSMANMYRTNFEDVDLFKTNMQKAYVYGVNWTFADLQRQAA